MYYDLPFMAPVSVEETEEVENALQMSDMEGLPSPSVFKSMSEEQLQRVPGNPIQHKEILNGE